MPSLFRRLAREAVIFMLLGLLFTTIGSFIYIHHAEVQRLTPPPDMEADGSPPQNKAHEEPIPRGAVLGASIPMPKVDNAEVALRAAFIGIFGFFSGFGVWLFYRLVRFAIKG